MARKRPQGAPGTVVVLGSGLSHIGWKAFGDNVPERAARLIREGKMGPAIFVFPDCFTALALNELAKHRRALAP